MSLPPTPLKLRCHHGAPRSSKALFGLEEAHSGRRFGRSPFIPAFLGPGSWALKSVTTQGPLSGSHRPSSICVDTCLWSVSPYPGWLSRAPGFSVPLKQQSILRGVSNSTQPDVPSAILSRSPLFDRCDLREQQGLGLVLFGPLHRAVPRWGHEILCRGRGLLPAVPSLSRAHASATLGHGPVLCDQPAALALPGRLSGCLPTPACLCRLAPCSLEACLHPPAHI